ncbi:MAG: glycerol-3-phosphate acyltransferase [Clostridia bacterium]|nr:glycerol-3-phosphate acyltransferase [Clostridia bacterium]
MLDYLPCILIGYFLGCISPSYLFSKIKKVDLRNHGTGNLGGSNTMMVLGKSYGLIVMLFDVMKAFLAVEICLKIFPKLMYAGIVAGTSAVLGHNFPFYLRFHGGKGLASLGGFILAESPQQFLFLLLVCAALTLIINYICVLPVSASILYPFLAGLKYRSFSAFFIALLCSTSVIYRHRQNIKDAREGQAPKVRAFLRKVFFKEVI